MALRALKMKIRIDLVLQNFQLRTQMRRFQIGQSSGCDDAVKGQPQRESAQSDKKDHQVRARNQVGPEPIIEDYFVSGYIGMIVPWIAVHKVKLEQHIRRSA